MRPKEFIADEHEIDPSLIDADALSVIQKLREAGYKAYLVGGGVRDLLIKRIPKDFDISTSARPQEIKQLFKRNCFLIGKRFRLAHVRFGNKVIEVSTFRSGDNESDLIIRDNTWGTEEEDVIRRDFTINGLFYDPFKHKVIDYVGGWDDIHAKILRTIGDPTIRFRQDPVRMIRLLKFKARFNFEIAPDTQMALVEHRQDILKSAPARILEEMLRMLESGAAAPFFHLMIQTQLLHLIFPSIAQFMEGAVGEKVYHFLHAADKINQERGRHPLERPILTACLLFPMLEVAIKKEFLSKNILPHLGEVMSQTSVLIRSTITSSFTHFSKKISSTMAMLLTMQYRLIPPSGKRSFRMRFLHSKEFPLALKFLKIRAMVDPSLMEDCIAWNNAWKQAHKTVGYKKKPNPPPEKK